MSKYVDKAMEVRTATPMVHNCAQAVLYAFADEMGITQEQVSMLGANFGSGMKVGSMCGAISGGLMVLASKGITEPAKVQAYVKAVSRDGMTDCKDLLRTAIASGMNKKAHCDAMIVAAIYQIEKMAE